MPAADPVAEPGAAAEQLAQRGVAAARVGVDLGAGDARRPVPDLPVQLLDLLGDAEFDGELAQFVELVQQDRVGYPQLAAGEPDGVPVEVDQADAALGVGPAQEAGHLAVGPRDHEVAQDLAPRLVRPDGGDDGGGHRQRAHHPPLGGLQAAAPVGVQPVGELPESEHHRIVVQLRRDGFQLTARRIAADHLALLVEGDEIAARTRFNPRHGRSPPSWSVSWEERNGTH